MSSVAGPIYWELGSCYTQIGCTDKTANSWTAVRLYIALEEVKGTKINGVLTCSLARSLCRDEAAAQYGMSSLSSVDMLKGAFTL